MSQDSRRAQLEASGLLHPHPEAVTAELFRSGGQFFFAADKVQVRYEMLRAHYVDGTTVVDAAAAHGYSRGGFYLVAGSFAERGMVGLLDERRGRKGPVKLTEEVISYLRSASRATPASTLVEEVSDRFGISVHRRTIERVRRR
jgi:transposase